MLWNILGAAGVSALIMLLIWALRGLLLMPVRPGEGIEITVRLDVSGDAAALEGCVASLEWLRANGTLPCVLEVRAHGLSSSASSVLSALERSERIVLVEE